VSATVSVQVFRPDLISFNVGGCSGTIIDRGSQPGDPVWRPARVLTAAHCVVDPDEAPPRTPSTSSLVVVCTNGNRTQQSSCRQPTDDYVFSDYLTGSAEAHEDMAILEIMPTFGATMMPVSVMPSTMWGDFVVRAMGYPGVFPAAACTPNQSEDGENQDDYCRFTNCQERLELFGVAPVRDVVDTSLQVGPNMLRVRFDVSKGHSGGPIYLCPSGACNDGAQVIGLISSWAPFYQRMVGPHATRIYQFLGEL
jgi:hypothetical protein